VRGLVSDPGPTGALGSLAEREPAPVDFGESGLLPLGRDLFEYSGDNVDAGVLPAGDFQ